MKWYSYLICFCLMLAGLFCALSMSKVWSEKSAIYGDISSIESVNKYGDVARLDFTTSAFETEDYNSYSFVETYGAKEFNGEKNNYALLFNDRLVSDVTFFAGRVSAQIDIVYRDNYGDIVSNCHLNITIEFNVDKTILSVNTINSDNSISYFERDRITNGAILKIVEKGVQNE